MLSWNGRAIPSKVKLPESKTLPQPLCWALLGQPKSPAFLSLQLRLVPPEAGVPCAVLPPAREHGAAPHSSSLCHSLFPDRGAANVRFFHQVSALG